MIQGPLLNECELPASVFREIQQFRRDMRIVANNHGVFSQFLRYLNILAALILSRMVAIVDEKIDWTGKLTQ